MTDFFHRINKNKITYTIIHKEDDYMPDLHRAVEITGTELRDLTAERGTLRYLQ